MPRPVLPPPTPKALLQTHHHYQGSIQECGERDLKYQTLLWTVHEIPRRTFDIPNGDVESATMLVGCYCLRLESRLFQLILWNEACYACFAFAYSFGSRMRMANCPRCWLAVGGGKNRNAHVSGDYQQL